MHAEHASRERSSRASRGRPRPVVIVQSDDPTLNVYGLPYYGEHTPVAKPGFLEDPLAFLRQADPLAFTRGLGLDAAPSDAEEGSDPLAFASAGFASARNARVLGPLAAVSATLAAAVVGNDALRQNAGTPTAIPPVVSSGFSDALGNAGNAVVSGSPVAISVPKPAPTKIEEDATKYEAAARLTCVESSASSSLS